MLDEIRQIIAVHAGLACDAASLSEDTDLYSKGMRSFAAVQVMLALEEAYEIEFPEQMLNRSTFRTLATLSRAVEALFAQRVAA